MIQERCLQILQEKNKLNKNLKRQNKAQNLN